MKKLFLLLLCGSINALSVTSIYASSKTSKNIEYPSSATFVNDKEHTRISSQCEEVKEKDGQIICTFKQIIVRHGDTKSSVDDINNLKKMSDEEIQSGFNKFCQSLDADHGLNKRLEKQYKMAASDEERKSTLYFKNVCTNPSRNNVTKWMEDTLQKRQLTCTVYDKTYEQKFRYNSITKQWVHFREPNSFSLTNGCGIINIAYLKKDSRKGWDFSWNYVARDVVTNKSGSVLGAASCSKLTEGNDSIENESTYYGAYSNLVETTLLMNCKYINFADVV